MLKPRDEAEHSADTFVSSNYFSFQREGLWHKAKLEMEIGWGSPKKKNTFQEIRASCQNKQNADLRLARIHDD